MPLNEEIAVLDGLGEIPGAYNAGAQFDPSMGGNLTGGSSWDPRMPLTPSNAGLADADLAQAYHRAIPSSYNAGAVFDPSSGANYKGGSSWDPSMPLTPSHADLASVPDLDLAQVYNRSMSRLRKVPNYYAPGAQFDVTAGANMTGGSSWDPALPLTPTQAGLAGGYEDKLNDIEKYYGSTLTAGQGDYAVGPQLDPTAGANYKGGSSWDPVMPLTPSNAGLAELRAVEPRDSIQDKIFKSKLYTSQIPAFKRLASQDKITAIKKEAAQALKAGNVARARQLGNVLRKIRGVRSNILNTACKPGFRRSSVSGRCVPHTIGGTGAVRKYPKGQEPWRRYAASPAPAPAPASAPASAPILSQKELALQRLRQALVG